MMKLRLLLLMIATGTCISTLVAQPDRWQQRISYEIDVHLDVHTNKMNGTEKIVYSNNSPDTLHRVFFHMYWNAFQPNSSMDVRSRELGNVVLGKDRQGNDVRDWDPRVQDKIGQLTPDEIGFQKAVVRMNDRVQKLIDHETILEVILDKPILPKSRATFHVYFEAQVPLQIRRAGRDSKEGVRFSMAQWYPKMVEYDYKGWHANPYIAREFHGVWGDYEVNVTLDRTYMVAATGNLLNPQDVGHGYSTRQPSPMAGNNLTWHFSAQNVHDFVWAADPDYTMFTKQVKNGPLLYVVYKKDEKHQHLWQQMADTIALAYPLIQKTLGPYPYKTYAFIQAGDGGMEYPLATFVKGPGVGTAVHEFIHSWYQMLLATNESLHHWMDEGFTTYATERILGTMRGKEGNLQDKSYGSYLRLVRSGLEEPAATHADHFNTNYAYGNASYSKGAVYVNQLGYIVGDSVRDKILLDYYWQWRYKHPNPNDFLRVAEKTSRMELDWYNEYWIKSTKTIDYAIDSLWEDAGKLKIRIRRVGDMPMPVDVQLTFKDGSKQMHVIPLNLMYGSKPVEDHTIETITHQPWRWTHPTYVVETDRRLIDITEVHIDPSQRLADVERRNNVLKLQW